MLTSKSNYKSDAYPKAPQLCSLPIVKTGTYFADQSYFNVWESTKAFTADAVVDPVMNRILKNAYVVVYILMDDDRCSIFSI